MHSKSLTTIVGTINHCSVLILHKMDSNFQFAHVLVMLTTDKIQAHITTTQILCCVGYMQNKPLMTRQ